MVVAVLVEISHMAIDREFDYAVPNSLQDKIQVGMRVSAPFHHQICEGFVTDIRDVSESKQDLKEIISVLDEEPILNQELLLLGKYMSKKYYATLISCYQTMLPKALKAHHNVFIGKKTQMYVMLNVSDDELLDCSFPASQQNIINLLQLEGKVEKKVVNQISRSSVETLLRKNILRQEEEEVYREISSMSYSNMKYSLTPEQKAAKEEIISCRDFPHTFLLHGVTGSGKTLVYLEIVEEILRRGQESIFLVPEISLTPQMVSQFKGRFGDRVAVLHSRLSEGEKYDEYRRIVAEKVNIVVGARSAIFAPFRHLGMIIIDEEHTSSYKQDQNPKYHAIDIALWRSKYHQCGVVLGSATPSLETYARAYRGHFSLISMKKRTNSTSLPEVELIDMNQQAKLGGFLSQPLLSAMDHSLKNNEQIILLLNRRGYSTFVTCSNCGYTIKCPHCDITLTYHKTSNTLRCHYCGYGEKKLDVCPNCREEGMKSLGLGTEKVEEELHRLLKARVLRMDLDTTTKKGSHEKMINQFREHQFDILLGTQMIAKGLDFPLVSLVGVINADTSLMIPNYNSSEATFQLLTQIAGRSGRGDKKGKVLIQTFNPDHYAIFYAKTHDYLSFFKKEMSVRHTLSYPPYYYLVYIKIISPDYEIASQESSKVGNYLTKELSHSQILGPTTCNVFKLKNQYRFGIIIKYKEEENLERTLWNLIRHYRDQRKIKIDIDVNPQNL